MKNLRFSVYPARTDQFKEQRLGTSPGIYQGSPAFLDFAAIDEAGALIDLFAGYTDLTLEIWANQESGSRVFQKTVVAADFDQTCLLADWTAGTKQPVRFVATGDELNLTVPENQTSQTFYMVIGGSPVDGEPETLGYATLKVIKDRFGEGGATVEADPASYYTSSQSDARYVRHFLVPMLYAGELSDEQTFGYFKAKSACRVLGAQLFCQEAPVGAAVTIDLIDGAAAEQTKIATLADGAAYQETTYGAALVLAAGDVIRAKVKSTGVATPGQALTCNLIIAPTAGA